MKIRQHVLALGLALLASGPALAVEGHESGGRIAASTVYLRFTSKGAGINSVAAEGADTLIKQFQAAKEVAETNRRSWGREGELDLCVRFNTPNARLRFSEAFDRVRRASQKASDGDVLLQVYASSCQKWLPITSDGYGAFLPSGSYGAQLASLACTAQANEPEGYSLTINLFETLVDRKPVIRFGVYQSAKIVRYRPILGEVTRFTSQLHRHDVSLEYEGVPFTLYVVPTATHDASYRAVYTGTVKLGSRELDVRCLSGRVYTP